MYHLNPEPLRDMDKWLETYRNFWSISLANLKRHLEKKETKQ
jgi:hypothetical protein